jgi:hypothetical protein
MEKSTLPLRSTQRSDQETYMKQILRRAALGLLLGLSSNLLFTQSTTTTTTDPAVTAAQNQQQLLDAQLKIQQDQQALLTGSLPQSSATPNSGAFTVSGSNPFPSQKLAYDQLNVIAAQLANKVTGLGDNFVMYDQGEINSLLNYSAFTSNIDTITAQVTPLKNTYDSVHNSMVANLQKLPAAAAPHKDFAPVLAPGLALGLLKTTSDIIGMFRTNTTIAYSSFTTDDAALAAAVAGALKADSKAVFIPAQMPLKTGMASPLVEKLQFLIKQVSDLQNETNTDLAVLQQLSDALNAYIQADQASQANQDQITAETDATKKAAETLKQEGLLNVEQALQDYACSLLIFPDGAAHPCSPDPLTIGTANVMKASIDHFIKQMSTTSTEVTALATAFSALQSGLFGVTNGTSALAAILRAEALNAKITSPETVVLVVKTSVLGGSVVTRQNLFTGGHLLFSGGAIAYYTVYNPDGTLLQSGVIPSESKNEKADF